MIKSDLARTWLKGISGMALLAVVSLTAHPALAINYSFSWSANPPPVSGYRFYYKKEGLPGPPFYGTDAQQGPSPIDIGNKTSFTVTGLDENATYHFAITAYSETDQSSFSPTISVKGGKPAEGGAALLVPILQLLLDDANQ